MTSEGQKDPGMPEDTSDAERKIAPTEALFEMEVAVGDKVEEIRLRARNAAQAIAGARTHILEREFGKQVRVGRLRVLEGEEEEES